MSSAAFFASGTFAQSALSRISITLSCPTSVSYTHLASPFCHFLSISFHPSLYLPHFFQYNNRSRQHRAAFLKKPPYCPNIIGKEIIIMAQNPIVTITMENGGVIKAELYPEIAPESVNNFISLIGKNFYDGVIFHRVIRGFMIQGGDPEGTGCGGPGYSIKGEFSSNGFKNDLKHTAVSYTHLDVYKRQSLSSRPSLISSPIVSCAR